MIVKKELALRLRFIFLGFFVLFIAVIIRLYFIQISYQSFYQSVAQGQYNVEVAVQPLRGEIYDRSSTLLAFNQETVSLFALPHLLKEKNKESIKTLDFLKRNYPECHQRVIASPDKKFLWVVRHLSPDQARLIQEENFYGLSFIVESKRYYTNKSCAHLIGFTDIDNNGIAGLELHFNKHLMGSPTLYSLEKDARSGKFYFEKNLKRQGIPGKPLRLTIDHVLQFLAQEELVNTINEFGAKSGAVVIMEPTTGEILAMVSYPPFDPDAMVNVPLEHTKNVATTESYEFGSVIKLFLGLAALEEGVVTPDEMIDCCGKATYIGKLRIENWQSIGIVPFREVIRKSSNVGTAKVALRLGSRLYDYLKICGFGEKTGIPYPGEREGFVNPPHKWSKFSPMVMSFGYEINGTVLQLARAMSIIANGGYKVTPKLMMNEDAPQEEKHKLFSHQTIETFKNILTDPETIFPSVRKKYSIGDYRIMGKTGTARKIVDRKYSDKKHIYTFAGIVEKGDYKRVIVTFVNEPLKTHLWASEISAPLFMKIAEKMVIHDMHHSDEQTKHS